MSVYCSRKVKVVSVVVVFGGDGREGRRLVEVNKIDDGVGQVSPSHALAVAVFLEESQDLFVG